MPSRKKREPLGPPGGALPAATVVEEAEVLEKVEVFIVWLTVVARCDFFFFFLPHTLDM